MCTIPLDTAKVRLQLQKQGIAGDVASLPKYKGMLGTIATIAREEGASALWKGIVPGLHRQCLYGGLRIGLYEPVSFESCCWILFILVHINILLAYLSHAVNNMDFEQVKALYVGSDHVGDVPLSKKILAAFTTGKAQCLKLCK